MDPVTGISTANVVQESRQEPRTRSGRRPAAGPADTVDVTNRVQRAAAPAAVPAIVDEAAAQRLVSATTAQILAEPGLAACAQGNGKWEGVLAMLQ